MSTIDYKALAERVAQRAIYADNNADPNNKAWAADLRAVVSLLNGMAEAQPVAWRCEVRDLLTQAEQCLSTAVQFAQWAHDEPPSYLSAWDYEADHIAAEIRAMLAAAPAVPQADAQPVAAVPVDWMERLKEAVKHIGYANVEKWYRLGGEDMIEQAKSDAVTAYATLCEALESLYAAPAAPQAAPMADSDADYWLRNRQPILDAIERAGFMLMSNASGFWLHPRGTTDAQAEPKREPLRDSELVTMYAECPRCDAEMIAFARAVERAHGIGGSDAE